MHDHRHLLEGIDGTSTRTSRRQMHLEPNTLAKIACRRNRRNRLDPHNRQLGSSSGGCVRPAVGNARVAAGGDQTPAVARLPSMPGSAPLPPGPSGRRSILVLPNEPLGRRPDKRFSRLPPRRLRLRRSRTVPHLDSLSAAASTYLRKTSLAKHHSRRWLRPAIIA